MVPDYISITDFETRAQVLAMRDVFMTHGGHELGRVLGVGVMMSCKTLNDIPSSWSTVFPPKERVADIFLRQPEVYNVLHYADYDGIDVARNLERATEYGGPNMQALQLDMIWPDPNVLQAYLERHPDIQIVLQVGAKAMQREGDVIPRVVARVMQYRGVIDAVLLDKSMGSGKEMDAALLLQYARALRDAWPDLHLVGAGGLGPETMDLIRPLLQEYPRISWDAQGKLRTSGDAHYPVEWDRAALYLQRSIALAREYLSRVSV